MPRARIAPVAIRTAYDVCHPGAIFAAVLVDDTRPASTRGLEVSSTFVRTHLTLIPADAADIQHAQEERHVSAQSHECKFTNGHKPVLLRGEMQVKPYFQGLSPGGGGGGGGHTRALPLFLLLVRRERLAADLLLSAASGPQDHTCPDQALAPVALALYLHGHVVSHSGSRDRVFEPYCAENACMRVHLAENQTQQCIAMPGRAPT